MKNKNAVTGLSPVFETDNGSAIVAGWLIFPALDILLSLLTSAISIVTIDSVTFDNQWNYVFTYVVNILFVPFLLYVAYTWWKRKRLLPKLMIIFCIVNITLSLIYVISSGQIGIEWVFWGVYLIWIGYFVKSKRVEETFVR